MEFPLVSILAPIYKVEKYVERCARSLFEQTYSNLEFVFVDDASPDKSIEILQQIILDYPKWKECVTITHHDKNRGLASSRNTLVNNSKGEFLLHVDSDDWIEPNAVELLVKRQIETGADIVTGLFCKHLLNKKNEIITKQQSPNNKDREQTLMTMLERGSVVALWNRLIRSSLYREHNIHSVEGINAGEDLLMTPRLVYYSQTVASCNHVTYHYDRTNPNSYVSLFPNNWEIQFQVIKACLSNVDFFKDKEAYLCEAMNRQLARRLKKLLLLTIENRNHYGYNIVLTMLDNMKRSNWSVIGWNCSWKRWLDHHYYIARLTRPFRSFHSYVSELKFKHLLA